MTELEIKSARYSYLDEAALYLTQEQKEAYWLSVRVNIRSYRPPRSFSFRRNPPQTIWGYATGVYQECVVFEKAVRFDYEQIYDDFDSYHQLARLMCIYASLNVDNLVMIAAAVGGPGVGVLQRPQGLTPKLIRRLDSIRVRLDVPAQFDFEVFWNPDPTTEDPCNYERKETPEPPEQPSNPPGPGAGGASSPAANPAQNNGEAIGPLSRVPAGAFPGDFSPRNEGALPTKIKINTPVELYSTCLASGSPTTRWDDVRVITGVYDPGLFAAELYGSGSYAGSSAGFNILYNGVVIINIPNPALLSIGAVVVTEVPDSFPDPTRPENISSDPCNFFP